MLDTNQIDQVTGSDAYSSDGDKIGKVGQVYLDDQSGQPEWVTVNTGLFGTNESFVPLSDASYSDGHLTLPYDKDKVKNAPNLSSDGHLSPEEEQQLYTYYGVSYGDSSTTGTDDTTTDDRTSTNTGTDYNDDSVTLSEERVDVGTRQEEVGRARLRKYVVTENVTQTVPVQKEKAVLEREPITDGDVSGTIDDGDAVEVTLTEERPVVEKTTEAVERVSLGTQEVTDEQTVTEEVRKERVETEGDIANDGVTTDNERTDGDYRS